MKKADSKSKVPAYPTINEFKNRRFLNIATAVGIGISATAISIDADAKDKKKVTESKKVDPVKKVKVQIILLAANLGHKDFKEREKSTVSLIRIGQDFMKNKKTEMSQFLKAELEKGKKAKDPEIRERVKKILLALTPPPPKIPDIPVDGDIIISGEISF